MPRVVRKQRPPDLIDYRKYKRYLRLDFERRCAYCHIPELRYGTPGNYAVDHFRPKSKPEFRRLTCQYSNLFYACRDCNLYKGSTWPGIALRRRGAHFLDPCRVDLSRQWDVAEDGALIPNNVAAAYMIDQLRLNRPFLLKFRRRKADQLMQLTGLTEMLAATPQAAWARLRGQDLTDSLSRDLLDEYGDFWTAVR